MKKYKVYYCYMANGVWEHEEVVEAENWIDARHKVLKSLGLKNVNDLDYIQEIEIL